MIALAAQNAWKIYQLDVQSAFLHGECQEKVFIEQPPDGYVKFGGVNKVLRLKKTLCGLKQAPRACCSRIDTYFSKEGFGKCTNEHTLYIKREGAGVLMVCLYVDDLIYTGSNVSIYY